MGVYWDAVERWFLHAWDSFDMHERIYDEVRRHRLGEEPGEGAESSPPPGGPPDQTGSHGPQSRYAPPQQVEDLDPKRS